MEAASPTGRESDPTLVREHLPNTAPTLIGAPSHRDNPAGLPDAGGRYAVVARLGAGGMGVVYRAHDKTLGRDVALKVLSAAASVGEETIERFQREARAAAALDHPNIIRVLDVGRLPGPQAGTPAPYYTMELLHGEDLSQGIAAGRIGPREAVEAVRQVSLALLYAHQKGILHRDIKPQNIFLRHQAAAVASETPTLMSSDARKEVHALVLDFGLAKLSEHDLASNAVGSSAGRSVQTLTRSGEIFGTPAYMAPEQTRGAHEVDARADVYSLGATLYHALTGHPPFEAATLAELLEKVHRADPLPPSGMNAESDADLDTLTLKCLQKDPKDRYQNAGDLAEDCRRWLAGEPIVARPVGLVGRVWRRAKRNKAVALPVALLVVGVLAGLLAWAGSSAKRAWDLRIARAEVTALVGKPDPSPDEVERAEPPALRALSLAPNDADVREQVARVRALRAYYHSFAQGKEEFQAYLVAKKTAADARDAYEGSRGEAEKCGLFEGKRRSWDLCVAAEEAARVREGHFATAVRALTEAIGHSDSPRARELLADLYWDRYVHAEQARNEAEREVYRALVEEFAPEKYRSLLSGVRHVRVRFLLASGPASVPPASGTDLTAYLFRYEQNRMPPVLAPVPCDPHSGALLGEPEIRGGDPVYSSPIDAPDAAAAHDARDRTAYPLRLTDANRAVLAVRGGEARFDADLPKASYLLYSPGDATRVETRYPFEVSREGDWDETCELPVKEDVPPTPPGMEAGAEAYWIYVPAGPCHISGDPAARQSPPREAAVLRLPDEHGTRGFFLARFEATMGMYFEYLNDRTWHDVDKAATRIPRVMSKTTRKGDRIEFGPHDSDIPVMAVSWYDANNFCKWLTAKAGGHKWEFSLPSQDEWEKAARGADGRFFPWGDSFDPMFCRMLESFGGKRVEPGRYGLFPIDEGPYGHRDLAGGAEEWTSSTCGPEGELRRIKKGGSWHSNAPGCRAAGVNQAFPQFVLEEFGFRVCAHRRQ